MTEDEKKNMTIIGGTRGLGRWLAEHLKNDFNITITSRDKSSGMEVADEIGSITIMTTLMPLGMQKSLSLACLSNTWQKQ